MCMCSYVPMYTHNDMVIIHVSHILVLNDNCNISSLTDLGMITNLLFCSFLFFQSPAEWLGAFAILLSSVNIFGGTYVLLSI